MSEVDFLPLSVFVAFALGDVTAELTPEQNARAAARLRARIHDDTPAPEAQLFENLARSLEDRHWPPESAGSS